MQYRILIASLFLFTSAASAQEADELTSDGTTSMQSGPTTPTPEVPAHTATTSRPDPAATSRTQELWTPPDAARFRYCPPLDPDSIQEVFSARSLEAQSGGTKVVPDFGATIGLQQKLADPVPATDRPDSSASGSTDGTKKLASAVFSGPAHFAFGSQCAGSSLSNDRAVVIYEGMSITTAEDGRYEVRFVVEAPDSNVILKLQLRIQNLTNQQPVGTITLAPITLTSSTADDSDEDHSVMAGETRTWVVRRTGFSHVLANQRWADRDYLAVTRSGTVRIGQSPDSYTSY